VYSVSGAYKPLSQTRRKRLGVTFAIRPLFSLADEIRIHGGLVREVVSNRPIHLFELEDLEILANGFRRLAPAESVNKRIKRNASTRHIVAAFSLLNIFLAHTALILLLLCRRETKRWEVETFLHRAEADHDYTMDDLERVMAAIRSASRE